MTILFKSNTPFTNPIIGTPNSPGQLLYQAVFGTGNSADIVGSTTADRPGIKVGTWQGTPLAFGIQDGLLVRSSNTSTAFVGLPLIAPVGAAMFWDVVAAPDDDGAIYLDLFRNDIAGNPDSYRLRVQGTVGTLMVRVGGVLKNLGTSFSVPAGSRVGVRWVGGLLTAIVNGVQVGREINSDVAPNGMVGVAVGGGVTGFKFDNVDVEIY